MSNCQFRLFLAFSSLILFLLLICLTEATENVRVQQVVESSPQNVSADSLDCVNDTNAEHISSTTTPAPAPPVVERIEVRLVDGENGTEETPLIIVDVVKKNGSGVAATIQQHQDSLDSKHPRPDQGFLVRLKQPNYHAVSYIPFELSTTTEMPEETTEQSTTAISTNSTTLSNGAEETTAVSSSTIISAAEKEKEEANASSNTEADAGNIGIESLGIGEMVQIVMQKQQQLEKMEKQKSREEKIIKNTMPEEEANLPGEKAGEEEAEASRRPTNEQWTDEVEEGGGGESADVGEEDGSVEEEVEEMESAAAAGMESEEALWALNQQEANETATFGEAADQQQQFHGDLTGHEDNEELEEEEEAVGDAENEECLANRNKLPKEMVKRLLAERRRVVQAIKKINKHQMLLCRPDRRHNQVPYRKCPMWRREKFFLYYALMRITYCGNHARWPGGRRFRAL